jgi:uncharacterized protein (TIGR03083 family)
MQKPSPILVADRFPKLLDALLNLLNDLTAAEWELPTAAAGWTVRDMALHLLGDDISRLSGGRDDFQEPDNTNDRTWDELVDWLNQRNSLWVQATRRTSPRLLCDLLRFTGDQVNTYFGSLDLFASGGPVSWAGPEPAPVWLDVAREFTERWHHQQHIRDAVGRPGAMEPYYLAPVLAAFVYGLPRAYQPIRAPDCTAITLVITGPSGGTWSVMRQDGNWQLYLGQPPHPQAAVRLPEDAAWRLFTKGISREAAQTQASFSGDPLLARQMLEVVSIIA